MNIKSVAMDNISVISLVSSSSGASPSHNGRDSPISVASNDTPPRQFRVNNGRRSINLEPSQISSQRVKDWFCSCKYGDKSSEASPIEVYDSDDNRDVTGNRVCIRYDFDKETNMISSPELCDTRAKSLYSYKQESRKTFIAKNNNSSSQHSQVNNNKKCEIEKINGNNSTQITSIDNPLSPGSHKKELCSYLQLMKPVDKSQQDSTKIKENRRSKRVRKLIVEQSNKNKTIENDKNKETHETTSDFQEFQKIVADAINYPTLKSLQQLNMKIDNFDTFFIDFKKKNIDKMGINKYMPLPLKNFAQNFNDFEDSIGEIVAEINTLRAEKKFREKRRKTSDQHDSLNKSNDSSHEINNISRESDKNDLSPRTQLETIKKYRFKIKEKLNLFNRNFSIEDVIKNKPEVSKMSVNIASTEQPVHRCEIISVPTRLDDDNVDLKNFVDDMLELDKMSEEHRKSVIESRILLSSSITNLIQKKISEESQEVQKAYQIFSEITQESQSSSATAPTQDNKYDKDDNFAVSIINIEHDYATMPPPEKCPSDACTSDLNDGDDPSEADLDLERLSPVPRPDIEVAPVDERAPRKSLQGSLTTAPKYKFFAKLKNDLSNNENSKHSIKILESNGTVLRAFYQDFNLVVIQRNLISFWTQSALGNILGAQNMWIPKGASQRLSNNTYTQKESLEMLITSDVSIAYVELWTKEHKSDVRQMPVADVFATVYFWRFRQEGVDKKALQLENIKGFTDDVKYVVSRSSPKIIVSWRSIQGNDRQTKIHAYHLAADFQIVAMISDLQAVPHYVASLHNVEDADNLIMGCGEDKITLWNVDYGYIVATVQLNGIKATLGTFWVKCDRGFLFTIQECEDKELRLIAINGMNKSWKKLQSYQPSPGFEKLKGVYIENGILVAYYMEGIICWNAENGELIVEELSDDDYNFLPSGKYVIMIANEQIIVRHSLSHFITAEDL